MSSRRKFLPPNQTRNYRRIYVIAVEGDRTEKQYFDYLGKKLNSAVAELEVLPPKSASDPKHVLSKLLDKMKEKVSEAVNGTQEFWMVIDRDQWNPKQLREVFAECGENNISCCVSNPAFQYWLLLHFENNGGIRAAENDKKNTQAHLCEERLRDQRYLPNFKKKITEQHWLVLWEKISIAIKRAERQDTPRCKDYHRKKSGTTVYRLVKKLMKHIK